MLNKIFLVLEWIILFWLVATIILFFRVIEYRELFYRQKSRKNLTAQGVRISIMIETEYRKYVKYFLFALHGLTSYTILYFLIWLREDPHAAVHFIKNIKSTLLLIMSEDMWVTIAIAALTLLIGYIIDCIIDYWNRK